MIRILYVSSTLVNQGPTIHLRTLLRALDRRAFDVEVLTLSPEPEDSLWTELCDLGITCRSLGLTRIRSAVSGARGLQKVVNEGGFDIVHSCGLRADILLGVGRSRAARISTRHERFFDLSIAWYGEVWGRFAEYLRCWALRRMDCVIAVSDTVRQSGPNRLQPRMTVIRNCVDTDRYCVPTVDQKKSLRIQLGLPVDRKIVAFVGRLDRPKDVETAIRGVLECRSDLAAQFVIVGDGPERARYEAIARKSSQVTFLGFRADVHSCLQAADLYLSGSIIEGLPLSVIEALGCGLPCVLSAIPSHEELAALLPGIELFPVGDWRELARILDRKLHAPSTSAHASSHAVKENFNAGVMARAFEDAYRSVLRR